jgi:hypothetical protein
MMDMLENARFDELLYQSGLRLSRMTDEDCDAVDQLVKLIVWECAHVAARGLGPTDAAYARTRVAKHFGVGE